MTDLTDDGVTDADLAKWFLKVAELNKLKQEEHFLRMRIFKHYFKTPKEGTNTFILPDKYQLKGVYVINRKVLEEQMQAMCTRPAVSATEFGPSVLEAAGVNISELLKWTPELSISAYRTLTAEQVHLVDQMLEVKEGSPQMKVEPPPKPRAGKTKAKPDDVQEEKGPQT